MDAGGRGRVGAGEIIGGVGVTVESVGGSAERLCGCPRASTPLVLASVLGVGGWCEPSEDCESLARTRFVTDRRCARRSVCVTPFGVVMGGDGRGGGTVSSVGVRSVERLRGRPRAAAPLMSASKSTGVASCSVVGVDGAGGGRRRMSVVVRTCGRTGARGHPLHCGRRRCCALAAGGSQARALRSVWRVWSACGWR